MFKWKDEYSCNIAKIDEQHKRLFDYGNELYEIISLNDGYDHYDELMNTLEELKAYTIYHFSYEEELMEKYEFDGIKDQKVEHKSFIDKIVQLQKIDIDKNQKKFSMEMLIFIANWIETHILKSDLKYKEYLNQLGVN